METTWDLMLEALVASPNGMLDRLERGCGDACEALAMDVASASTGLKAVRSSSIKAYLASVVAALKSMEAVRDWLKAVSAGLDTVASLCASAIAFPNTEAVRAAVQEGRRGSQLCGSYGAMRALRQDVPVLDSSVSTNHLGEFVDLPNLANCRFACELGQAAKFLPRGQHSFALHVNGVANGEAPEVVATFTLLPADVCVAIDGDPSATCECQRKSGSNEAGVMVVYAAASTPDNVGITIRVFGATVLQQRLVRLASLPHSHLHFPNPVSFHRQRVRVQGTLFCRRRFFHNLVG